MKPLYAIIKENLRDGALPEDFTLDDTASDSPVSWAPGAKDGVFLYHMRSPEPDPAREEKILEALTLISKGDTAYDEEIITIFEELDKQVSIVRLYDDIQRTIAHHIQDLDLGAILNYGDYLISYGMSFLAVKIGLTLLGGFKVPFVKEVLLEFGAYDEFTYYAARVLSGSAWEDGNSDLFRLAKNVHGWGRIHAVEYLAPETQEIKDWLLYEGAENTVMQQYSADACLQKAGVLERLDGPVSQQEFGAISRLIGYCIEGGPCPGITNAGQLLPKYLKAAEDHQCDRNLIQIVQSYYSRG